MHLLYFFVFVLLFAFDHIHADNESKGKMKKDPLDLTDSEANKLFEQWEENDKDILPEDERHDFYLRHPHGKHQPPMFKPEEMIGQDPENLIKISKKGRTMMMFTTVSGNPTRRETEEITQIWWAALKNAFYDVTKYIVDDNRVLFLLQDGAQVFEIKDYLIAQDRCQEVTIDNRPYYGKGAKSARQIQDQDL